ncbi:MAG: DUF4340 domain-containing protein [Treponema sp.]|jgi:hypothetical protein|nr:DUF4340 domain-containing protein [Treponema sp.]
MVYKQKLVFLSGLAGLLALVYVLTLVFEPERAGRRSAAFNWIDPKIITQVENIRVSGPSEAVELTKKNGAWRVLYNGAEYPARQLRVEDFLGLLSKRAAYPVRASTPAAQERLGLTEETASRIVLSAASGSPLLDLLVGQGDQTGQEVYLRKAGQNEIRSGEDLFSGYISGSRTSWYNLRLFPESEDGTLDADAVQRLTVYPPAGEEGENPAEPRIFSRSGNGWTISGIEAADPDTTKVDSYIRGILNTEGDDFSESLTPEAPAFDDARLVLELGDGSIHTLRLGKADDSNRRPALVSGSPYVYFLAGWATDRLFREGSAFEK